MYYKEYCNTYGSLAAYIVGLLLRALGGEDILNLPPIIKYPWYNEIDGQLFPFRTFAMLSSFATLILVSAISKRIFESGFLPPNFDIFHCVINIPDDVHVVQEPNEEMTVLSASQVFYYQTSEINGRVNQALDTGDDDPTEQKDADKANHINKIGKNFEERLIRDRKNDFEQFSKHHSISCSNESKLMPNIESVNPGQVIITKL